MNWPSAVVVFALCVAVPLTGCGDTEARERLRQNAKATWGSAVDVAVEAAAEVQSELERRLEELEPRIEALREQTAHLNGQARQAADRRLAELEAERLKLRDQVIALKQQSAQAWERMVREAQGELDALSQRLDSALETQD